MSKTNYHCCCGYKIDKHYIYIYINISNHYFFNTDYDITYLNLQPKLKCNNLNAMSYLYTMVDIYYNIYTLLL